MKAFWGAFGGWVAGQVALALLSWWAGVPQLHEVLTGSLCFGGIGSCIGACISAGRENVPACGCLTYLVLWVGLAATAGGVFHWLGLPYLLVFITVTAGVLTGFWLMGDGPLSPLLLLFLLLFTWVYGALTLFLPPAVLSVRNLASTLGLLLAFQLAHVVLARMLRPRRKSD